MMKSVKNKQYIDNEEQDEYTMAKLKAQRIKKLGLALILEPI